MKTTKKKVKITNYKKAYEEIQSKYIELAKAANSFSHWASALEAAEKIKEAAYEELPQYRNIIIKHDV